MCSRDPRLALPPQRRGGRRWRSACAAADTPGSRSRRTEVGVATSATAAFVATFGRRCRWPWQWQRRVFAAHEVMAVGRARAGRNAGSGGTRRPGRWRDGGVGQGRHCRAAIHSGQTSVAGRATVTCGRSCRAAAPGGLPWQASERPCSTASRPRQRKYGACAFAAMVCGEHSVVAVAAKALVNTKHGSICFQPTIMCDVMISFLF